MSTPTRETLVQALAQINALEAQAASVKRAIETALQIEVTSKRSPHCYEGNPDLMECKAAARKYHLDPVNLRRWAKNNPDLGKKMLGRWFVSCSRLEALLGFAPQSTAA